MIFDSKTLKTIDTVKATGQNPDFIVYDPSSKRVFTFNGRGGNATAMDAATAENPRPRPTMVPGSFRLPELAP